MQTPEHTQTDFLAGIDESQAENNRYSEVCNALYERELFYLSQHGPNQLALFKRRLAGLSHHIKRAALHLTDNNAPIDVDTHNGSWQSKQASKSPARNSQRDTLIPWYQGHAKPGLVVPVRIQDIAHEHVELDSIDRVQQDNLTLHLNKNGWFSFDGTCEDDNATQKRQLLKPTKAIMTAACCGHSWNHKGKVPPRTLTLRELLLSTNINWKKFTLPAC